MEFMNLLKCLVHSCGNGRVPESLIKVSWSWSKSIKWVYYLGEKEKKDQFPPLETIFRDNKFEFRKIIFYYFFLISWNQLYEIGRKSYNKRKMESIELLSISYN